MYLKRTLFAFRSTQQHLPSLVNMGDKSVLCNVQYLSCIYPIIVSDIIRYMNYLSDCLLTQYLFMYMSLVKSKQSTKCTTLVNMQHICMIIDSIILADDCLGDAWLSATGATPTDYPYPYL